ncbi:hypothetical protein CARUB_v10019216mg [Capsella rubella]|uniref:BAH domain-containing protein n=1 Tax=Capsella rubella TaxID=81985 RepID=R0HPF9_9BRAS|nr:uncharacterized protein LOC17887176 [Capsella rubella]EOA25843.1 hypothetical protein CARUB_v10019216mg [Capsella rubella]
MKRIKKDETEDKQVNKKEKIEWRREICAYSVGKCIKVTGGGENRKCYYETFQFRGTQYSLEDTVLLDPYESKKTNYIALIKDIYVKKKDGFVKILVQWFYRQEDIKIKHAGKCESGDSEEIFFSFHQDEVFAESARSKCLVYFVPDDKQSSNLTKPPDFIVQKVYDNISKKLRKFSDEGFSVHQKFEISTLLAKTSSRTGDSSDIKKVPIVSKSERSVRKRDVSEAEIANSENNTEVNLFAYKSANDLDRDKRVGELLQALFKHICCASKEKEYGIKFVSSDNVVEVVLSLEEALYDSFADDIPKYNYKLALLIEKFKSSKVLVERILTGELKPEQVTKMQGYELIMADFEEPKTVEDAANDVEWTSIQ